MQTLAARTTQCESDHQQVISSRLAIGSLDAGALHNIWFEADLRRFDSFRLGDGANVKGERKAYRRPSPVVEIG